MSLFPFAHPSTWQSQALPEYHYQWRSLTYPSSNVVPPPSVSLSGTKILQGWPSDKWGTMGSIRGWSAGICQSTLALHSALLWQLRICRIWHHSHEQRNQKHKQPSDNKPPGSFSVVVGPILIDDSHMICEDCKVTGTGLTLQCVSQMKKDSLETVGDRLNCLAGYEYTLVCTFQCTFFFITVGDDHLADL